MMVCVVALLVLGEMGRVKGGCVNAQGWQSNTFYAVQLLKIKIDLYKKYIFLFP